MPKEVAEAIAQLPRRSIFQRLVHRMMPFRRPEQRERPGAATESLLYGTPDRMPGAGAPCLLCGRRMGDQAGALIEVEGGPEGYFWQAHFGCMSEADSDDLALLDVLLVAMILRNGG